MDGAQVAIGLSMVATLGALYNTWRQNQNSRTVSEEEGSRARLELAFEMQEKQLARLETQLDNTVKNLQVETERGLQTHKELQECKAGRHQLEMQVEILKLRIEAGRGLDE